VNSKCKNHCFFKAITTRFSPAPLSVTDSSHANFSYRMLAWKLESPFNRELSSFAGTQRRLVNQSTISKPTQSHSSPATQLRDPLKSQSRLANQALRHTSSREICTNCQTNLPNSRSITTDHLWIPRSDFPIRSRRPASPLLSTYTECFLCCSQPFDRFLCCFG